MLVNTHEVIDRHNRPSVNQRVALRAFFINDGNYQDPVSISGVTIFNKKEHTSPSTVLTSAGLIASGASSQILMHFGNSAADVTSTAFNVTNYTPGTGASGIYKLGTGQYVAILDGTVNLSGTLNNLFEDGNREEIANAASPATTYIDVWTVKLLAGSAYKTVIQDLRLYDDTFFVISHPLLLKPTSKLITKKIKLNSKVDLKLTNEVTLENRDIDAATLNIFKDAAIVSGAMQIVKHNEEASLPSRVTVSAFSGTSSTVDVTADNTLIFNWDTSKLATHSETTAGNLGSLTGHYSIQAKFNLLNQTFYTDLFNIIVY